MKRIISLNQYRPGHGEEEKVQGSAVTGEGGYDKEREGRD